MDLPGTYEAIDVLPDDLAGFIRGLGDAGFVGGNVTIPHKQAVFAALDRVEPEAEAIGAVNTVWLDGNAIVGGNTDAYGFTANLDDQAPGWDVAQSDAVVIGAGGAARAIVYSLCKRGLRVQIVNRTPGNADVLARQFGPDVVVGAWDTLPALLPHASILVNTTSLGMAGAPPLELDLAMLRRDAVVADIVYVPLLTPLLRDAAARGHRIVDGLGMLLHQAAPGFRHWFGGTPLVSAELRAHLIADLPS